MASDELGAAIASVDGPRLMSEWMDGNTDLPESSGPLALTRELARGIESRTRVDFHGVGFTAIDRNAFVNLRNVESLDLSQNCFTDLSDVEWPPTLKTLYLHENRLTEIPSSLRSTLRMLWIFNNKLTVLRRDAVRRLPNLQVLLVNGNQLEQIEDNVFTEDDCLTHLDVSENRLDDLGHNVLPRTLRWLSLARNMFSVLPPTWLEHAHALEHLALECNPITNISPDFLPNPCPRYLYVRCFPGRSDLAIDVIWDIEERFARHVAKSRTIPLQTLAYMNKTIPNWCDDVGKHVLLPFLTF